MSSAAKKSLLISATSPIRRTPSPVREVASITRSATAATRKNPERAAKAPKAATTTAKAPTTPRSPRAATTTAKAATTPLRSPRAATTTRREPKDPYSTPFWPPSNYQVPAKNTSNYPSKYTVEQYKLLIEKLKNIFTNEKIIDRDNAEYQELLKDQQSYNKLLYNLKPKNIVCFVVCEYYLYDKRAPRVFHVGNNSFGNFEFNKLLRENNMSMKWLNDTTLYIHKNRF